jgi:Protein of unknown function (DUF3040)
MGFRSMVAGRGAVMGVLSDAERRVLAHVEARLSGDDPELAVALLRMRPPRGRCWIRVGYNLVVIIAALEAMVCLLLYPTGSGPAGLLAAGFAAFTVVLRDHRYPLTRRRRGDRAQDSPERWL